MLRLKLGGVDFSATFWFFAVVACFALAKNGVLFYYLLLPVIVHELGHLLVMAACGIRVRGVALSAAGIAIQRDTGQLPGYGVEIAVCLGGVAANGLMALWLHLFCFHSMRTMFLVAANLAVALFNLAPIGDLDGGQLLGLFLARWFGPDLARWVSRVTSWLGLGLLFGFALWMLLAEGTLRPNPTLLVACVCLAAGVLARRD